MAAEIRHLRATLILDSEDGYARRRGTRGRHPRPLRPLRYHLLVRRAGLPDFDNPLELVVRRNASGFDLFFGVVTRPGGIRARVTQGAYTLRVTSPDSSYQPIERAVTLPQHDTPVFLDLSPGYAYPFPTETLPVGRGPTLLRGTYLEPDGAGVAGTIVQVDGWDSRHVTDERGQWVLAPPDDVPTGEVAVRFVRIDGTVESIPGVLVVAGRSTSLGQTALSGAVLASGVPVVGATVAISGTAEPVRVRADGTWSFYFPLTRATGVVVTATAALPDGREQAQTGITVAPRETTPVPTFEF